MISKTITYIDFDGQPDQEEAHFHMDVPTAVEFFSDLGILSDVETPENLTENDLSNKVLDFLKADKVKNGNLFFKTLIQKSYGRRVGKSFIRRPEWVEEFMGLPAYSIFFQEVLTNTEKGVAFFNGVFEQPSAKPLPPRVTPRH